MYQDMKRPTKITEKVTCVLLAHEERQRHD